jgi:hypothetical protein
MMFMAGLRDGGAKRKTHSRGENHRMPRRKKLPLGAIARSCPVCGQTFRPMTLREWANNLRQHELMSEKHKKALKRVAASA